MGQPVAVTPLPSSQPGLLRFEANRSLTGMGHEHYTSLDQAVGPGSAPTLARRLLQTGQVDAVHVFSNIVTVDLHKGFTGDSLSPIIEDLYTYYREGFVPPPLELPAEEAPAADGGDGARRPRVVPRSTPASPPTCSSAAARPRSAGWPSRADGRAGLIGRG